METKLENSLSRQNHLSDAYINLHVSETAYSAERVELYLGYLL